jgi:glucose-1-phosphate thymidylyltransferase
VKGILLAAGQGSRLGPLTFGISKHLLAVHDKPMIYYSLSTLLMTGVSEIALILNPRDSVAYRDLLGDGEDFGVSITYLEQPNSLGIAHGLLLAKDFLEGEGCVLILGDNIFFGTGIGASLEGVASGHGRGGRVFLKPVKNPHEYGVAVLDLHGDEILEIEEKPVLPASNLAIAGLYIFDGDCIALAEELVPSKRGELEITDLLEKYRKRQELKFTLLGRGVMWLDAGTVSRIEAASELIRVVQERDGLLIGSPEEIAFGLGKITDRQLISRTSKFSGSEYGNYFSR